MTYSSITLIAVALVHSFLHIFFHLKKSLYLSCNVQYVWSFVSEWSSPLGVTAMTFSILEMGPALAEVRQLPHTQIHITGKL